MSEKEKKKLRNRFQVKKRMIQSLLFLTVVLFLAIGTPAKVRAASHTHIPEESSFVWTFWKEDGEWCCNVEYCCEICSLVVEEPATIMPIYKDQPTCTMEGTEIIGAYVESGEEIYSDMKVIVTPALGHDMEEVEAKAATCTESGNSAYKKCSRCDYYEDSKGKEIEEGSWIIPETGHTVHNSSLVYHWVQDEETGEWTCTDASYVCEGCASRLWELCTVNSKTTDPTCTEAGKRVYTASLVEHMEYTDQKEVILEPALGHDMEGEEVEAKAATCTESGNSAYKKCKRCDHYEDSEGNEIKEGSWIKDAKGHELEEVAEKKATCTESGNSAYKKCSRCEHYEDSEGKEIAKDSWGIDATGHDIDETGKTTVSPTDTKPGVYTYNVCRNGCGQKTEVKLPQKKITVTMGKTYTIPTNSAYTLTLLKASTYSNYLRFDSKTGKILTYAKPKYYSKLKSLTIKVTTGDGKSYNITVKLQIPKPKVSIKRISQGKNYKYKFSYNIKYATKVKVRVEEQKNNKKLNKVLDKYVSKPKSKSSSYFTATKKGVKALGKKLTFKITVYYGKNTVTFTKEI